MSAAAANVRLTSERHSSTPHSTLRLLADRATVRHTSSIARVSRLSSSPIDEPMSRPYAPVSSLLSHISRTCARCTALIEARDR